MSAGDWNLRLSGAHSTGEVVALSREFIAQWTPAELAHLPEACRPHPSRVTDADDIALYAFLLVRADRKVGQYNPRLTTFAAFFTAGSARLAEIAAAATEPRIRLFATK